MFRYIVVALTLAFAALGAAHAMDNDDGPIDEAGEALVSAGNKAAEVGHQAVDSASDVAETVGDAVVKAGNTAIEAAGNAAATASDVVTDTLGLENDAPTDETAPDDAQ